MAQTRKKIKTQKGRNTKGSGRNNRRGAVNSEVINEIILIITIAIGFLLVFSVYTDNMGIIGEIIGEVFKGLLGIGAYILPVFVIIYCLYILFKKEDQMDLGSIGLATLLLWILISIVHLYNRNLNLHVRFFETMGYYYSIGGSTNGGLLGALVGDTLLKLIGTYGAFIILYATLLILMMMITRKPIIKYINHYAKKSYSTTKRYVDDKKAHYKDIKAEKLELKRLNSKSYNIKIDNDSVNDESDAEMIEAMQPVPVIEPVEAPLETRREIKTTIAQQAINEIKDNDHQSSKEVLNIPLDQTITMDYKFPSIELLNKKPAKSSDKAQLEVELNENAIKLEKTLKSFGVEASVLDICRGPAVTRYELQPKEGVKVSKIVGLSDDIALNLAAVGIRIEAPIPGKSAIGIEIPNKDIQAIYLREILESKEFQHFGSKLAFGVGKDITGNTIVADISKMPHMLIAGATGSGKSVCINTIITSIIYKADPKEVKLIMVDPKVVELSVYNGIPHLLIPVVTDPKKAAGALNWAVNEMINRYKLFAEHNVRDIKGYNEAKHEAAQEDFMPHMVIIIDELADLMMASPKEVEDAICRLAQMARAAGMHLIIATQRPSVDVITGVIKANIPSRIAFAVSSGIDSRTILDTIGAEKLLGKGDMLFYPSGMSKPVRIQGAFVSDKEVEKIVSFVKSNSEASYNEEVIEKISSDNKIDEDTSDCDEYLQQAIELVVGKDKASVSMLQRYFRIGFNRASRLMEQLESRGIVGADEGSKPRKVLITKEEFDKMNADI